ncbi:copper resistance protein CopC [Umezawaea sp. NPDC059074]|uniref:copper resistance CopC family protein n=1 Tax=Umezawaea sp. NPDC059074 TaxID=3346716 RepID=UPI0036B0A6EB
MRRGFSFLLAGVIAGGMMLGLAGPALAHNVLVSSDPLAGSSIEAGPSSIALTFDQPVNGGPGLNAISVTSTDGGHWETPGEPTIKDNVVSLPLRPLGPAGEYTVSYRILSADGHPVADSLKFTLTKAGTGTPAPANEVAANPASTPATGTTGETGGGVPIWVWILGAVVLLGGGVFLALRGGVKEDQHQ